MNDIGSCCENGGKLYFTDASARRGVVSSFPIRIHTLRASIVPLSSLLHSTSVVRRVKHTRTARVNFLRLHRPTTGNSYAKQTVCAISTG